MKRFLSVTYSAASFNIALLILRVGAAVLLIPHGYNKLKGFDQIQHKFINFLGLGSQVSLSLAIFAELFCSLFIILGLFTRLAAVPIVITLAVAVAKGQNMDIFGKGELPSLFFLVFVAILLVGPGRVSIDGLMRK